METVLLESSLSGDLGLEDLDLADLFIFCEDEFSIVFEDEDLEKIVTVNDLVNFCFQNILDTVDVNPPYNPGGSLGGGTDSGQVNSQVPEVIQTLVLMHKLLY